MSKSTVVNHLKVNALSMDCKKRKCTATNTVRGGESSGRYHGWSLGGIGGRRTGAVLEAAVEVEEFVGDINGDNNGVLSVAEVPDNDSFNDCCCVGYCILACLGSSKVKDVWTAYMQKNR